MGTDDAGGASARLRGGFSEGTPSWRGGAGDPGGWSTVGKTNSTTSTGSAATPSWKKGGRGSNGTLTGPRAKLASEARSLLSKNPAGMCGGLLNQRIRQAEQTALEVAYGATKEQQKGWLQDLMSSMPDVKCRKEGRDNWYFLPGAEAARGEAQACETATGEPEVIKRDSESFDPPASTLVGRVRSILRESPEGISGSMLGIRLRKLEPQALEEFHAGQKVAGADPASALSTLVESLEDVRVARHDGSVWYSAAQATRGARVGPPSGRSADAAAAGDASPAAWLRRLKGGECGRRYQRLWGGKPPPGVPLLFLVGYVSVHLLYVLFHG